MYIHVRTLQKSKNFLASSSETKLRPHAWFSAVKKKKSLLLIKMTCHVASVDGDPYQVFLNTIQLTLKFSKTLA